MPPLVPPRVGAYFGNTLLLGCDPTHPNKMLCSFAIVVNTHGISELHGFLCFYLSKKFNNNNKIFKALNSTLSSNR